MCAETWDAIGSAARKAILDVCWSQWQALGALAVSAGDSGAESIIDPEALVLGSLGMSEHERRLEDFLTWWAETGSMFMSVQRLATLSSGFPESARVKIGRFAASAANAGDKRWEGRSGGQPIPRRGFKGSDEPHLLSGAAAMVRLRAAFGVGVKADVLTFLLGMRGAPATVREIAHATAYSERSVRTAATEMALAGMVRRLPGRPARYRVVPEPWSQVLYMDGLPAPTLAQGPDHQLPCWRYWSPLLAFLLSVVEWWASPDVAQITEYVRSSRARDIYYQHEMAFVQNDIHVPSPEQYLGDEYLEGLLLTLTLISEWVKTNT